MTAQTTPQSYAMLTHPVSGTTGAGFDQLVDYINNDPGLAGANNAKDITAGAAAADRMNQIILEAAIQTESAPDGIFTSAAVVAINAYIRANYLAEWTALHGDDEGSEETGVHRVQNDGATTQYRGDNLVNTVADGIYHIGFEIQDGRFLNEDGAANASVEQVAAWLTQFYTDHSTTSTGLDRIVNLIMADAGLPQHASEADIEDGADAADGMNHIILAAMNAWLRADPGRLTQWTVLHGDDENGEESGFHWVQNDGANTPYFGQNLVNTVVDGIYHMGFEIQDGRFLNEDGNQNATVSDVADWLNYFYSDASTTGTGLDKIVDTIKIDTGLAGNTPAVDINAGAGYADALNHIIVDATAATGAMNDGWFTVEDMYAMNAWLRADSAHLNTDHAAR